MSDQSPVSDGNAGGFGLIETLLWTPEGGFSLLPEHLARLAASAAQLGFAYDRAAALSALEGVVAAAQAPHLRVRLVLSRNGALETGATPIEPPKPETLWSVAIARRRFSSDDPLLRHKTTRRDLYEGELAEAQARLGVDEVLFLNERDEICEAARTNIFLPRDGVLLTPPLSCGLLPGTLRQSLLASGKAREEILHLSDVSGAGFFLGNSVRGLVRAALLSGQ